MVLEKVPDGASHGQDEKMKKKKKKDCGAKRMRDKDTEQRKKCCAVMTESVPSTDIS